MFKVLILCTDTCTIYLMKIGNEIKYTDNVSVIFEPSKKGSAENEYINKMSSELAEKENLKSSL